MLRLHLALRGRNTRTMQYSSGCIWSEWDVVTEGFHSLIPSIMFQTVGPTVFVIFSLSPLTKTTEKNQNKQVPKQHMPPSSLTP